MDEQYKMSDEEIRKNIIIENKGYQKTVAGSMLLDDYAVMEQSMIDYANRKTEPLLKIIEDLETANRIILNRLNLNCEKNSPTQLSEGTFGTRNIFKK